MVLKSEVNKIQIGRYIMMDDEPCKITSIQRSAPGKHGHAKFRVEAHPMFGGGKKTQVFVGGHEVDVPEVIKKTGQVISMSPKGMQVMDLETYEVFETLIPSDEELKNKLVEGVEVYYWNVEGRIMIKSIK